MPDGNYYLGDVDVSKLVVFSERGSLDLTNSFVTASIYESIFTPGMICDIEVLDMNDQLGELRLSGDELLELGLSVKGRPNSLFKFHLEQLSELQSVGAMSGKKYTLKCVSEEAMYAKTNFVQKSYNMLCSQMVEDIHRNYLRSQKTIRVEDTRGPQTILIPHKNPYEAINLIRQRSVSSDDRSSLYVYFENRREIEAQTFNFVTIENLFRQSSVKVFKQDDSQNISILQRGDDNILAFRIPTQFSSADRIALGGPRRITTFNPRTFEYQTRDVQTEESNFRDGGTGTLNSSGFRNRFFNADIPPQSVIPVDTSGRPTSFIPESTPDLQAFLATILQNSVRIRVIGDTILTAGAMITCSFPNKRNMTVDHPEDRLITGDFLISRIHHRIGLRVQRPRYTCMIECLKGRYEESV